MLSATQTLAWTVTNTNRAPLLADPGNQTTPDVTGYATAVLADGPVSYWRLGEAAGTVAADSAGSRAGTYTGGVTLGQSGALADLSRSLRLDGSTGYVQIANAAALQ